MASLRAHLRLLLLFCYSTGFIFAIRRYTRDDVIKLREEVRGMFHHAYNSYLKYAYPYDELRPLSCDGIDTWGSYSLTLIDALDTLAVMGNYTEFQRVVEIISARENFDANINVSVFETNIRLVGGLLSAHLLSHRAGVKLEPGWPCNGPLLRLAEDVAQRLVVAFDTPTGMPYGTVNLRHGVPAGETSVTCTAGIGTFIVEFGALSRLTGDPIYEEVALHAIDALYNHRSTIGLLGNHVDVLTGRWVAQDSGIGAGIDSYYEYLVKGAILFQKPELMDMFNEGRAMIDKYLKISDGYVWASMTKGQVTLPIFQSLEAYWPGVLSLIGDSDTAMRIVQNYHSIWSQYGFTPEEYKLVTRHASSGRESYPLRPEHIESIMYLYRDTRDPILLQMGEDILRSLQHSAKTECGYATIKDVRDHRKEDRMESFFLSETTKYLYLLFDPDNFIHNTGNTGTIIDTPTGECIIDAGGYIFNTEAHPIDPTALYCCHKANKRLDLEKIDEFYNYFKEEEKLKLKMNQDKLILNQDKLSEVNESLNKILDNPMDINFNIKITEISSDESKYKSDNKTLIFVSKKESKEIVPKENQEENSTKNVETIGLQFNGLNTDRELIDPKGETITASDDSSASKKTYPLNVSVTDYRDVSENSSRELNDDRPIPPPVIKDKIKNPVSMWPDFVQGLLINSFPEKVKCEPQTLLEKIRKEKLYPKHPASQDYHLLQTPAPSFLRRISLGGEFVIGN